VEHAVKKRYVVFVDEVGGYAAALQKRRTL
jgi:hypothetical protein